MLIIFASVAMVIAWMGSAFLVLRIYYRLIRAKGYTGPVPALMACTVVISCGAAALALLRADSRSNDVGFFLLDLLLWLPCAALVIYIAGRLLPRKARVAGPRKVSFPFIVAGTAVLLLGVAQFVASVGFHRGVTSFSASAKLLFYIAIPAGLFCFHQAKRMKARSAEDLLLDDMRPPVLYLRAFATEETCFISLRGSGATAYTSNYSSLLRGVANVTFEQYFGSVIKQGIGPFIALGNPLDYVPPEGAARTYQRDDNWTETFLALARTAACILIQVGDSRNLRWELGTLKSEGLLEKVFVFTSPRKASPASRLELWMKGVREVSWTEFVGEMRSAGYHFETGTPAPGSVFSFDRDGGAVLVASDAMQPEDYLKPVIEKLDQSSETKTALRQRSAQANGM